jgi:photosystem II stability/assembly factor-like uncharacterized protein
MSEEVQTQDVVYSLAASPNFAQDGICFAACQSGLYRSDDGGGTWGYAYDSLKLEEPLGTTAVSVSPDFDSDRSVFAGAQGAVLHSANGGESWGVVLLASPPPLVSAVAVSPNFAEDGTLFVGTMEDGVFLSSDRGAHFHRWNFGLLDLNVFCVAISPAFVEDETVFVGTETGVFRSTNGGRAWREVSFPIEFAPVLSLVLSPGYVKDGILFAGTDVCGLFRSDDRGQNWEHLGEGFVSDAVNSIVLSPMFPSTPDVLVAHGASLSISRDGGRSWAEWRAALSFEQGIASVAAPYGLSPDAPLLIGLAGGGVLRI